MNLAEQKQNELHVIPEDDLKKHELTEFCKCNPYYFDGVWVHNAFDKREFVEILTTNISEN